MNHILTPRQRAAGFIHDAVRATSRAIENARKAAALLVGRRNRERLDALTADLLVIERELDQLREELGGTDA